MTRGPFTLGARMSEAEKVALGITASAECYRRGAGYACFPTISKRECPMIEVDMPADRALWALVETGARGEVEAGRFPDRYTAEAAFMKSWRGREIFRIYELLRAGRHRLSEVQKAAEAESLADDVGRAFTLAAAYAEGR